MSNGTTDVAEVASGLTAGERAGLLSVDPDIEHNYSAIHGTPRVALFRKGALGSTEYRDRCRFRVTALGLAIRQRLQDQSK